MAATCLSRAATHVTPAAGVNCALRRGSSSRVQRAAAATLRATTSDAVSEVSTATDSDATTKAPNFTYVDELEPRAYEVGADATLRLDGVADLLQEAAWRHADEVQLASLCEGLIPVLTKIKIKALSCRRPRWGEKVKVETWFAQDGRLAARRDWILSAPDGTPLVAATSKWVLLNLETRRLARVPKSITQLVEASSEGDRFVMDKDALAEKMPPSPEEDWEHSAPLTACTLRDYDMNGHCNNVSYIRWALQAVESADILDGRAVHEVTVEFKAEAFAGQSIESVAHPSSEDDGAEGGGGGGGARFVHSVSAAGEEKTTEVARVHSVWM